MSLIKYLRVVHAESIEMFLFISLSFACFVARICVCKSHVFSQILIIENFKLLSWKAHLLCYRVWTLRSSRSILHAISYGHNNTPQCALDIIITLCFLVEMHIVDGCLTCKLANGLLSQTSKVIVCKGYVVFNFITIFP